MAESELTTIARPYARAVFAYATSQSDGLASWSTQLGMLKTVLGMPEVEAALENPRWTTDDATHFLSQLLGELLKDEGHHFLKVLAAYGRLRLIPTISTLFEQLKSTHEQTLDVAITSAFEITAAEKSLLSEALKRKLQRKINMQSSVDKNLIGGLIIKAGDMVIDDSVSGRLSKLSYALR